MVPSDALSFHLVKNQSPKTILKITNTSAQCIVFKVKTTQPSWYYVRPNQQMVRVGATEEVSIVLVDNECNRLIEAHARGNEESLDKIRFLVQTALVTDGDAARISSMSSSARSEEYTRLLSSSSRDNNVVSTKMKVEFIYPQMSSIDTYAATSSTRGSVPAIESIESMPPPVANTTTSTERSQLPGFPLDNNNTTSSLDGIVAELQSLRRKYDDVIAYTSHLTAERDWLISQNEETRRELAREAQRNKTMDSPARGGKLEKAVESRKVVQQGFSLFIVLFFAILSFLLGIWTSFRKH